MSNLFTRVFVFFWATLVTFAVATAVLTAVNFAADAAGPQRTARQAQAVLDAGGVAALQRWLAAHNAALAGTGQNVLILDAQGVDILGQRRPRLHRLPPVGFGNDRPPPGAIDDGGPRPDQTRKARIEQLPPDVALFPRLVSADGSRYVLLFNPLPSRGPLSPPFSGWALASLLLLALAVSGLVSYAFARSLSRPLERVQTAARRLAGGDLAARVAARDSDRHDEIGALAREFNAMAARLAALIEARRQLLRDVSHELRSPLARLQMAVGISRQPGSDVALQIERIERESGRLEVLIARILEYARLERDPATLVREDVDVVELVRRVLHDAEFEAQAPAGRVALAIGSGLEVDGACMLHADPAVLHTALDNVVRNAFLHGGEGAIEVSITRIASELTIVIRDHGPGVPPHDLGRIFEPFYRVANDGPQVTGHGIGLALAARAVALHGGRLDAQNAEGGGLRVHIVLPAGQVRSDNS